MNRLAMRYTTTGRRGIIRLEYNLKNSKGSMPNSLCRRAGRCVTVDEFRQAMEIDWMIRKELSQAIPPAYTEYIGKYLIKLFELKV